MLRGYYIHTFRMVYIRFAWGFGVARFDIRACQSLKEWSEQQVQGFTLFLCRNVRIV